MALNRVPTIYRKEMLDISRDRRTLVSMIVVPVAAMPLLFYVIGFFMSSAEKRAGAEATSIALRSPEALPELAAFLQQSGFAVTAQGDLRAAVQDKHIAAGVEIVAPAGGVPEVRIYNDETRQGSQMAARNLRRTLDKFRDEIIRGRLEALRISTAVLKPFTVQEINVAPQRKMAGFFWGGMLGYIVVLLMFSGGMYPVIDMTAGEKERRTLEIFLAAPAGREEIVLGKLLAATTAVFLTAVLSVTSMVVSFRYSNFGKPGRQLREMATQMPLDATTIGLVLLALAPTAVMAASLMIAIALMAKSFKEAQSYLTPLVMAVVFPLVAGMLPGVELTPALALVPLFNVCQLIKQIFQGEYTALVFAITMAANIVYAGLAFFAAVRVFSSERVLFRT
jgi:sodium transport system permease protein